MVSEKAPTKASLKAALTSTVSAKAQKKTWLKAAWTLMVSEMASTMAFPINSMLETLET